MNAHERAGASCYFTLITAGVSSPRTNRVGAGCGSPAPRSVPGGSRRGPRVGRRRQRSNRRANAGSGFRSVVITPPADRVSVKVRLPGGAVIELGEDSLVIERVVGQLLEHQAGARADGC